MLFTHKKTNKRLSKCYPGYLGTMHFYQVMVDRGVVVEGLEIGELRDNSRWQGSEHTSQRRR